MRDVAIDNFKMDVWVINNNNKQTCSQKCHLLFCFFMVSEAELHTHQNVIACLLKMSINFLFFWLLLKYTEVWTVYT